jgi:PEP-CTERM motif
MRFSTWFFSSLVFGTMLLSAGEAAAETVSFITTAIFTGGDLAGTNEYLDAAHGVDILFNSSLNNTVTIPPATHVSFGTFDTAATTTPALVPVVSGFILTVTEISGPNPGASIVFNGTFNGSLSLNNSGLALGFAGPLSQNIGPISFAIASADGGTPGTVFVDPPSTNNGVSTISGIVNANAVPEPSSVVMMGLGLSAGTLLVLRGRRTIGRAVAA